MARKRYQKGYVSLVGKMWVGRYREDFVGEDGRVVRRLRAVTLGSKKELPTKHLAERRLEVHLAPINAFSYRPGRTATVAEFAERWKREVLSKRKPSTIHGYESHLKIQIVPHLGKLPLDQLGVENQQAFISRIAGTVSRNTLRNVLATLSSMLTTAKNWGYTCEGVDLNKLALPERGITERAPSFTPEQAGQIIARATGQFRTMFALAAMVGLRAGELLALQASDFDFEARVLRIRRSVWRGKLQTVKNVNSEASLPTPEPLAVIVKEHIQQMKPGQEFLFINSRGHLFIAENVVRQALVPILDALKIPRCGFHAFRHAHTSLLLASGAAPTVAQAQLRHSDARITLGIYGHIIGDAHREAVDKVAAVLFSSVLNAKGQTDLIQ
jgi:integrase